MKKYRAIIVSIILIYILTSGFVYYLLSSHKDSKSNLFRVEINRLVNTYKLNGHFPEKLNCESVKQVHVLADKSDNASIEQFYEPVNEMQMEIVPVKGFDGNVCYLRFDYVREISNDYDIVVAEAALAVFFVILLVLLIYISSRILKPFHRLKDMPYELSKGNLQGELKENKEHFFGKFIWGLGMLRDSLDGHRKKELALAKEKKMILLTISHDIKTPLNAINLYAKGLEQGMYESLLEQKEAAIKIQEKTVEINQFIKEIIQSATEEVVTIDVKDDELYLKDLVTMINDGYVEKMKLLHIDFSFGNYENHIIRGDIDRLYEAVGNLIENACKYGDGKEITISFEEEDFCQLIKVYNSGEPVREEDMLHLFESFYRGKNVDGQQGNGLGLYICREIMKKMQGDIFAKRYENGMEVILVCRIA